MIFQIIITSIIFSSFSILNTKAYNFQHHVQSTAEVFNDTTKNNQHHFIARLVTHCPELQSNLEKINPMNAENRDTAENFMKRSLILKLFKNISSWKPIYQFENNTAGTWTNSSNQRIADQNNGNAVNNSVEVMKNTSLNYTQTPGSINDKNITIIVGPLEHPERKNVSRNDSFGVPKQQAEEFFFKMQTILADDPQKNLMFIMDHGGVSQTEFVVFFDVVSALVRLFPPGTRNAGLILNEIPPRTIVTFPERSLCYFYHEFRLLLHETYHHTDSSNKDYEMTLEEAYKEINNLHNNKQTIIVMVTKDFSIMELRKLRKKMLSEGHLFCVINLYNVGNFQTQNFASLYDFGHGIEPCFISMDSIKSMKTFTATLQHRNIVNSPICL